MKISIVCSDPLHPVMSHIHAWKEDNSDEHSVDIFSSLSMLPGGDILFLISCSEFLRHEHSSRYRFAIVLHASDLPIGRGWSPHIWQIIEGAEHLTLTALSAADKIDSGDIWKKVSLHVPADALYDEINELIFDAETRLMTEVVQMVREGRQPHPQPDLAPTYYRRRIPADSEIDPHRSIADQFNILRVCDPFRFPAFFRLHGEIYKITLTKEQKDGD